MNTEELRPIDARTMKPGDPVVRKDGTSGRLVAHIPEAHAAYRSVFMFDGNRLPNMYTEDGRVNEGGQHQIFLPPDSDPVDPSPGNVDKLRKSQVGEGWRIVEYGEKPDRRAQFWKRWAAPPAWSSECDPAHGRYYSDIRTYRVPIAPIRMVPLEMKDFAGKPWPLAKNPSTSEVWAITAVTDTTVFNGIVGWISFANLREYHPVSWDHGVTWVKAEKEEQV